MYENGTAVKSENDLILGITSLLWGEAIMKYLGVNCHDVWNLYKWSRKKTEMKQIWQNINLNLSHWYIGIHSTIFHFFDLFENLQ